MPSPKEWRSLYCRLRSVLLSGFGLNSWPRFHTSTAHCEFLPQSLSFFILFPPIPEKVAHEFFSKIRLIFGVLILNASLLHPVFRSYSTGSLYKQSSVKPATSPLIPLQSHLDSLSPPCNGHSFHLHPQSLVTKDTKHIQLVKFVPRPLSKVPLAWGMWHC